MHIIIIQLRMTAKEGPFGPMSAAGCAYLMWHYGAQSLCAQKLCLQCVLHLQYHMHILKGLGHSGLSCCARAGCRSPGAPPTQVDTARNKMTETLRNPLKHKLFLIDDRDLPLCWDLLL